jgi:D-serine dehydratase
VASPAAQRLGRVAVTRGGEREPPPTAARSALNALSDVQLPALLLHEAALHSNIQLMASFCATRDLLLSPHAKTSMSAYVTQLQLEAGAWGVTVATPTQAQEVVAMRAPRVLLANVLVDAPAVRWVAESLLHGESAPAFSCYVDNVAGLDRLTRLLSQVPTDHALDVMVEVGYQGGRTGTRSRSEGHCRVRPSRCPVR